LRLRWRQPVYRDWLIGEFTLGHFWPRADAAAPRLPWTAPAAVAGCGRFITLDFSRTVSGYLELEIEASEGQIVDVSYDELIGEQAAVNPCRTYAHLSDRYILRRGINRLRTTHPRGFRYVILDVASAGDAILRHANVLEETYPFSQRGSFTSSDPNLDFFYRKAMETVRICTTDCFTDCPTRERVHWMEDLYMHSLVAMWAFGDTAMVRRALFQAAQCALPDGRINGFFPSERVNCAFASSSLMWLALLAEYWRFTAAAEDIARLLPACERLLAFIASRENEAGLIADWPVSQFWEWAPIEHEGCLLLTNAAYAFCLALLAAEEIFRPVLPEKVEDKIARLRSACHRLFWVEGKGVYADRRWPDGSVSGICSQAANAMAILAGIAPAEKKREVM
ncbi:MAG: family 78 glycoside hydrolase catalytic domain, partial [Planctomycetota bacterium]|nr:family 78 glycoside hydrolase catalytic domain [Planctomycetota bacterium]